MYTNTRAHGFRRLRRRVKLRQRYKTRTRTRERTTEKENSVSQTNRDSTDHRGMRRYPHKTSKRYDANDWNCFLDHRASRRKPSYFRPRIRFQPGFVLDPLGRIRTRSFPSRATGRSLTIVLRRQQITFRALCRSSADSLRVYFAVSFLYGFFIVRLAMSSLCFSSIFVISRLI